LLRGERSREKLVELDLPNRDELRRRLSAGAEVLEGKADQRTEPAEKGRREYLVAGERTRIRQFNRFDVARWLAWPDHPDPIYSPYNPLRMSGSMAAAWYDDLVQRQAQQPYAVDDLTGTMIGRIFLRFVNRTEGSSVLGIDFDPRYVGQGYGLDSLSAFLTYYFGRLGFRRLLLSVAAYNLRARRSYERCGFVYLTSHWERFNCEANVLGDDRYSELRKYFRRGRAGLEALFHTMVAEKSD
jgi:RimJ/RimL family protein N-acetyltransferase